MLPNKHLLTINPEKETKRIVDFLKNVFDKQQLQKAVIGLSGGIDSATCLYLLQRCLPAKNIFVVHLYYFQPLHDKVRKITERAKIPEENVINISIKKPVDDAISLLSLDQTNDKVRIGNIAARMRMIFLFDLAKKVNGLVCGTENKSENLLGYFTRFGDQASDIEPIAHLYKTQVLQLAAYLGINEEIIRQNPTAGLWEGQTDEKEFGFTYQEADQVLFLHNENGQSIEELEKEGFANARRVLARSSQNAFKHTTPYHL